MSPRRLAPSRSPPRPRSARPSARTPATSSSGCPPASPRPAPPDGWTRTCTRSTSQPRWSPWCRANRRWRSAPAGSSPAPGVGWRQVHHHGSLDDPDALHADQQGRAGHRTRRRTTGPDGPGHLTTRPDAPQHPTTGPDARSGPVRAAAPLSRASACHDQPSPAPFRGGPGRWTDNLTVAQDLTQPLAADRGAALVRAARVPDQLAQAPAGEPAPERGRPGWWPRRTAPLTWTVTRAACTHLSPTS